MREMIEVADGVFVATSRVMSTTSTVLAGAGEALLIDPSWRPDELEGLADALEARSLRVIGGFATHAHHDHLLWHRRFGAAPRFASTATAALARDERAALVAQLGEDFPAPLVELMGRVEGTDAALPASAVPAGFAPELIVHDGHESGHTAVWLPDQRVLVAGDMLSDIELPLPYAPDNIPAYLMALDLLAGFAAQAEVVVPGHGAVGADAVARVDADRRYLDAVLAGTTPDDSRLGNPGMQDVHDDLALRVAAAGQLGSS